MKADQHLLEAPEKLSPAKKPVPRPLPPTETGGSQWQFKVLIVVITLCVLMLIAKVLGLF